MAYGIRLITVSECKRDNDPTSAKILSNRNPKWLRRNYVRTGSQKCTATNEQMKTKVSSLELEGKIKQVKKKIKNQQL